LGATHVQRFQWYLLQEKNDAGHGGVSGSRGRIVG
jgi:hypothetical protein